MKNGYIEMPLETLGDLLLLYQHGVVLRFIEASPFEDHVRLHVSGDGLPDQCSESPTRVKLCYDGSYSGITLNIVTAE